MLSLLRRYDLPLLPPKRRGEKACCLLWTTLIILVGVCRGSSRAKHLSRVGAEYTHLLYHVSKSSSSAFIDELRWRIDRISSTLSSDLDHLFSITLNSLINDPSDAKKHKAKPTEADRARWLADLGECLKTYDALGLWRDAEDVLRREVMRPFVKKVRASAFLLHQ